MVTKDGLAHFCTICCLLARPESRYGWCMDSDNNQKGSRDKRQSGAEPIVSLRGRDGTMVEMILRPSRAESLFVSCSDGNLAEHKAISLDGRQCVPYSARNNLLTHRVMLLPSAAGDYESEEALVEEVRQFIHRYVDIDPAFEEVAAHYVLLTWGYDTFNELPYLRVRGDYGSGKSRFLLTVGSLCYKPLFASGASTVSPIFRLIDQVGGTLVVDEADFRFSDERAEITKILNCGFARGFPVLRAEVTPTKEFNPRAFNVFGPKLVATRHGFEDEALESRCLTSVLGERPVRQDIPITLPRAFEAEAEALRNKLLMYRFRRFGQPECQELDAERDVEPRRAQIAAPLLSVATNPAARERLRDFLRDRPVESTESSVETEQRVLRVVRELMKSPPLTLQGIAKRFELEWGEDYGLEVSPRWMGSILRRLGISPQKSNGIYIIPVSEWPRLRALLERRDLGDIRDERDANGGPHAEPVGAEQ